MKILIWQYSVSVEGGHSVQARRTHAALRDLGVHADLHGGPDVSTDGYNLVHGFGLPAEIIRKCRLKGLKVALSTIYWSRTATEGYRPMKHKGELLRRAKQSVKMLRSAISNRDLEWASARMNPWREKTLEFESADVLLPNSHLEAMCIRNELGTTTPMHVVPNAVDIDRFAPPQPTTERSGVLCVARFEPHKNQLSLIKALRGSGLKLLLIGPQHPDHRSYYDTCRSLTDEWTDIKPRIPDDELPQVYARAKVHVLASRFETTGLSSLEAAASGCNVVTTSSGFAREYFGRRAWYCDWDDPESIRRTVQEAHRSSVSTSLQRHVTKNFTWQQAARETEFAYRQILGGQSFAEPIPLPQFQDQDS